MEYRIQRLFLASVFCLGLPVVASAQPSASAENNQTDAAALDEEVFDLGVFVGIINIGDFTSEPVIGISGNFQASEDFFLQYNYLQADTDLSSFEVNQAPYFSGDDRTFEHYDLLLGYKLFQAEMYPATGETSLASLYVLGGVGDTQFGGESNFTYTLGVGYRFALARRYIVHFDYKQYIYESTLIRSEESTNQAAQFSVGLNYLF